MSQVHDDAAAGRGDGAPARALPQLRLTDDGPAIRALPPEGGTAAAAAAPPTPFEPFEVPQIPKSLTDHLALLGERFRGRHGRCVAAVLLLDAVTKQWSSAIPAQRSARDAACWSAARADFPHFPERALLAGSFQTRVLSAGERPADCPPPHDGLHFVLVTGRAGERPTVHCFVRAGGHTRAVRAADLIVDDLDAAIAQALPRLTLT